MLTNRLIRASLLLLLLMRCMDLQAQSELPGQPHFKHLTVEDGLSHNWVKSILKDHQGFMWFGTFNGLNRYDGRQMLVFQSDTINSLSDNVIECIAEDGRGVLWIGTFSGGLNRFNRKTQRFTVYKNNASDPTSLPGNKINCLYTDRQGDLWIGTDRGLARFADHNENFVRHLHPTHSSVTAITQDHNGLFWIGTENGVHTFDPVLQTWTEKSIPAAVRHGFFPKSIYEDKYGQMWIGTWGGGLISYDLRSGKSTTHVHQPTSAVSLSHNAVLSVTGDQQHRLYIGTENGGLNVLDLRENNFLACKPEMLNARSINSNSIHHVYFDEKNGILWAGTYNGGVNYFSQSDKPFELYQAGVQSLNNNHITSIAEDRQGNIWIGTDGGGVNKLDAASQSFSYFTSATIGNNKLQSDATLALLCDRHDAIWAGSFNGGIDVIQQGRITHFTHHANDTSSLSGPHVSAIYEDKRGNIWAGTMSAGLNLYEPITRTFKRYRHDASNPSSIIDDFIYALLEDRSGRLLVLTGKGIDVYDYRTDQFTRFAGTQGHDIGVPVTLHEDSQGNLWVGSQEKGLFRFDRTGVKVNQYTRLDGLPSNSICGILEDEHGNLWISTQRGLCKFEEGVVNPARVHFHRYSTEDGLQGTEFKTNAYCKLRDGRMAFGGQNGFNVFDPEQIRHNAYIPAVVITGFKLFNREVKFGEGQILPSPINELQEIALAHHQSVLTFEFSALNYLLPEKNQYAYRLEGFEDEWNQVGTQRTATYSNLDAGEYVFRVKASNNDGIWNETGTSLRIRIIPPWYNQAAVRIGFILLLVCMVIGYFRYRTYQLRKAKRELERQVDLSVADLKKANTIIAERQTEILYQNQRLTEQNQVLAQQTEANRALADEIRDLNAARTTFFSHISKEVKVPLDVLVTQMEEMLGSTIVHPEKLHEKQNTVYQNARQIIQRIKQLLDFGRAEQVQSVQGEDDWQDLIQSTTILVVDSDPDPVFLQHRFTSQYHFAFASNAATGMRMALDNLPDLILCDAQLPDQSGMAWCQLIRQDERTSHIPIILMTSRFPDEGIQTTLSTTSDDHIAKPIQAELLDVKIRTTFLSRQKIRDYFFKGTNALPADIRISAADELFLEKATRAVREHLQMPGFGVDAFSAIIGMSRRHALRKMKALTGLSINEYIRNTRLHEAYSLLKQSDLNISEIAYTVGFTDPKYFSNCFKKLFGKLPSEIRGMENKV
jgi:ligand-binding sensor domain-containing protein/AraC-like DNA-binding protein/CheY-like chemotaxis protein